MYRVRYRVRSRCNFRLRFKSNFRSGAGLSLDFKAVVGLDMVPGLFDA